MNLDAGGDEPPTTGTGTQRRPAERSGRRRPLSEHAGRFALPLLLTGLYAWHLARTGLPANVIYEAGDSAGDMLQVRRATEQGWFTTGHHSDVGVHHPGPFGLWVKALTDVLHRAGVGGSTYALTMSLFLGLRLSCIAIAAAAIGRIASSRIIGWAAALGVALMLGFEVSVIGLDLQGATIHFLSPWSVLLTLTGAALAAAKRGTPHLLILGAGVTAHVHAPSFPLGAGGLVLGGLALLAAGTSPRTRVTGYALWAVFVVPLCARVVLEPGFPFNYLAAVGRRRDIATSNTGRTALEGLGGILDLPTVVLLAGVLLPAVLGAYLWRHGRTPALTLIAASAWAGIVLVVSPRQDRAANELIWIAGMLMFSGAVTVAAVAKVLGATLTRSFGKLATPAARTIAAGVAGTLLLAVTATATARSLPEQLPRSGGSDGRHVPVFAGALTDDANGRPFALVLVDPNWFTTASGLLLELERRNVPFCVAANSAFNTALETFVSARMRCREQDTPLPSYIASWDAATALENMPTGSTLTRGESSSPGPVDDPDRWICAQRATGGTCVLKLPEDVAEIAASNQPDTGAYGNNNPLRLLALPCTPHPDWACRELAKNG
jgi:hypothetical protein